MAIGGTNIAFVTKICLSAFTLNVKVYNTLCLAHFVLIPFFSSCTFSLD